MSTPQQIAVPAPPGRPVEGLTIDQLRQAADDGTVDTVVLALPDMDGRLQGKRVTARHFLDVVASDGAEACAYLLATDVEMTPADTYALSGWASGFGDFALRPDFSTLRPIPWLHGTALVLADAVDKNGAPISVSPRQLLRDQLDRLAERGLRANASTELEFVLFRDSYRDAWDRRYNDLTPALRYNTDYSLQATSAIEPLIRRIRLEMGGAGMTVETSKGECGAGQHEINFRYEDALRAADNHVIYKNGAKEIAQQEELSLTFMAKFNEGDGSSCHVHISLAMEDGSNAFARDHALLEAFLAGQLACLRELSLMFAPQVNSYKRFVPGMFAPTAVAWGRDNRTCAFRQLGHGEGLRIENRVPGADVNPYLAIAATIAAGLHGIESNLQLEAALEGSAYDADKPRVPHTLGAARELFIESEVAKGAFGTEVVKHYAARAQAELEAFERSVTDWERIRGFERL